MMWGYYYNNASMMVWGIIMSLLWLSLAALAVWALIRWLGRASRPTPPTQMPGQPSPLDILNVRYARGEIDTAMYQSMRERLEASTDNEPAPNDVVPSGR